MAKNSLSKGGIYYLIYNVLNMVFPFLSGIYVSHVLLPDSIGSVAAAQNLAQYFVILAFLGIPTYGLREISRTRNNKDERDKIFSELFIINLISTVVFFCIYIILIFTINAYRDNFSLYLLAGISIALNAFNINWLYEGLEEFRFVSVRNIVFKMLSFGFLVLFVRNEKDVLMYALVHSVGTAGNYIVSMIYSPRFAKIRFKDLNLYRHIKSIMYLVVVNLAIELYSLVDITMMNFMCSKENIAFYKYGRSIEGVLLQVVNTFTMVLVPRLSYFFKENNRDEFNKLLSKGLVLIYLSSLPMIVGLFFTGDFLLVQLYGNPYIASASVLKILSLLLFISPIGYLLGSRVLLVCGRENFMVFPVCAGAVANIIGNAVLIPCFGERGAALASVISEIIVMTIYVFLGKKHYKLYLVKESIWKIVVSCASIGIFLYVINRTCNSNWGVTIMQIFGAVSIYCFVLLLTKERVFMDYLNLFLNNLKKTISQR